MKKILFSLLAASLFLGTSALAEKPEQTAKPAATETEKQAYYNVRPDDVVLGDANAPVTIVEYASLTCPHCAHFHAQVFPALKQNYIDTGKVKFAFRHFPLDEPALRGSMLAYCAGKDRYYTFTKVLFDKQDNWAFEKNYLETLTNIGKLGGVSSESFDKCLKDKALENKILENKLSGAKILDVSSTPTFFINGKKFNGANNVQYFSDAIEKALSEAGNAPSNTKPVN